MLTIDTQPTRRFVRWLHVACLAGTLLGVALGYVVLYAPTLRATTAVHEESALLRQQLDRAPEVRRNYRSLSKELQEKQQQIAHVRRRVPVTSEENSFLAQITHTAEQVGIAITNLQSGQPQQRSGYSQLEITLSGLTTYESLCRFVDQVSQFDRMVRVVGMNLRTNKSQQQLYPVDITFAIYFGLNAS